MKALKTLAKRLLLRGPLSRWWIHRRARQLDGAFLEALRTESAGDTSPTSASPGPNLAKPRGSLRRLLFIGDCMWEQNELFPEIRKICELEVVDLNPALRAAGATPHAEAVVAAIQVHAKKPTETDPDLILFYARPALLSDAAFDAIRRRWSCPLLGLNLDDRVEFFPYGILSSGNDNYARWSQRFDLNLTSSIAAMDWYRNRGAAVRYLPQGFRVDSKFADAPAATDYEHRLSFVGSWKPERGAIMDELRRHGVAISIFGKGWPDARWIEDPGVIFRRSQINLGIGLALASGRIANPKGRDIECPAVGSCYLTTYCWELANLFEIGKEILCYRNIEELVEIHSYYSRRPADCLAIARAAHRRCLAEHTWEQRLRSLFRDLNFTT